MSRVRVVYKNDGTVAVIAPAPKSRLPGEAEEVWLQRVFDKATPGGLPYDDIDDTELPSRDERESWAGSKGKGVSIDMVKSQDLKRARTRRELIDTEKEKILEAQAIESLKAQGKL